MNEISSNQELLNSLALYTTVDEPDLFLVPINIFTVAAYSDPPSASIKIINAFSYLQGTLEEENRFDSFIRFMTTECRMMRGIAPEKSGKLLTVVVDGLMFINAILDNLEDPEMRIHVRNQIYRRPFRAELDALRELKHPAILRQLNVFTALLHTDAEWAMEQYSKPANNFMSTPELFQVLLESLKGGEGVLVLTHFMQHLLCVRADSTVRTQYIRLLDKTLEQILLKGKGIDPDFYACPIPYLSTKELERILVTKELDAVKEQNMKLKFELMALGEERNRMNSIVGNSENAHSETVASLKSQIDLLEQSLKEASECHRLEFVQQKQDLESTISRLTMELQKARDHSGDLEKQINILRSLPSTPTTNKIAPDFDQKESINDNGTEMESAKDALAKKLGGNKVGAKAAPRSIANQNSVKSTPPPPPPPPPPMTPGSKKSSLDLTVPAFAEAGLLPLPSSPLGKVAPPPPPAPPLKASPVNKTGSLPLPALRRNAAVQGSLDASTPFLASSLTLAPCPMQYPAHDRKLKAVQWKKVFPKDINGSIWECFDATLFRGKVDFNRINQLFQVQPSTEVVSKSALPKDPVGLEALMSKFFKGNAKMHICIRNL